MPYRLNPQRLPVFTDGPITPAGRFQSLLRAILILRPVIITDQEYHSLGRLDREFFDHVPMPDRLENLNAHEQAIIRAAAEQGIVRIVDPAPRTLPQDAGLIRTSSDFFTRLHHQMDPAYSPTRGAHSNEGDVEPEDL